MTTTRILAVVALLAAIPASAQQARRDNSSNVTLAGGPSDSTTASAPKPKPKTQAPRYIAPIDEIQYIRHADARGLNVFESPKVEGAEYTGLKLSWGGAFTQQFQNLTH